MKFFIKYFPDFPLFTWYQIIREKKMFPSIKWAKNAKIVRKINAFQCKDFAHHYFKLLISIMVMLSENLFSAFFLSFWQTSTKIYRLAGSRVMRKVLIQDFSFNLTSYVFFMKINKKFVVPLLFRYGWTNACMDWIGLDCGQYNCYLLLHQYHKLNMKSWLSYLKREIKKEKKEIQ